MNINEADKAYFYISRTYKDNLIRFSWFSFLQQRAFKFHKDKVSLHMTFKRRPLNAVG